MFAVLLILSGGGIAVTLHHRAETQDSLDHWVAREQAEQRGEVEPDPTAIQSPRSRIRRLEQELDAIPERLFAYGVVFALSLVFLVLGWRWWQRNPRAS